MIMMNSLYLNSVAVTIALISLCAPAAAQENATCQVILDGTIFIDGRCSASRDEGGSLVLGSREVDQATGMPLSRLSIEFDETGEKIDFVRYNKSEMSRFADLSLSGLEGSITDKGGCIQSPSLKACFIPDSSSAQALSPKDIFEAASETTRKSVQKSLRDYGYYRGDIDGTWGQGTEQALNALHEVSHAFSSVDQNTYWFDFDEQGMRQLLADVETNEEIKFVQIYSFCDNLDGHLLDVEQRQGRKMRDVAAQVYVPVAEKWCPLLFVEGD